MGLLRELGAGFLFLLVLFIIVIGIVLVLGEIDDANMIKFMAIKVGGFALIFGGWKLGILWSKYLDNNIKQF